MIPTEIPVGLRTRLQVALAKQTELDRVAKEDVERQRREHWVALAAVIRKEMPLELIGYAQDRLIFHLDEEDPPADFALNTRRFEVECQVPHLCPIRRVYAWDTTNWHCPTTGWAVSTGRAETEHHSSLDAALVAAYRHFPKWMELKKIDAEIPF